MTRPGSPGCGLLPTPTRAVTGRPPGARSRRAAVIIAAKGGTLADVTIGDVLELLDAEREAPRQPAGHCSAVLRGCCARWASSARTRRHACASCAPRAAQPAEQMIDRYRPGLPAGPRPARGLPAERQPALDYSTLQQLGYELGKLFWADLEQHHPGIDSLHLPDDVARAWKQRLRSRQTASGAAGQTRSPRAASATRHCLTTVRAFYLDLAQWALDDPARWGPWAVPCPVRAQEISQPQGRPAPQVADGRPDPRAAARPARPGPRRRPSSGQHAAGAARGGPPGPPGRQFTAAGQTLDPVRAPAGRSPRKVWARRPRHRQAPDLTGEEDHAFWAWAIIEVLRAHRHPGRGTPRAHPPQPGPVPAPRHRRARAAAADRPVQDRRRTAPGRQPRARRRAQPRSSAASAARRRRPPGPPPTTATSTSGCRPPRCCSSAGPRHRDHGASPSAPSATCSTPPSPAPA